MTQDVRVAMVIQAYYPIIGGAERQLQAIAPRLMEQGIDVVIVTKRYRGLAAFEEIDGVPVYRLLGFGPKALGSISFTVASLRLLRRLRPDVIHAHNLFSPLTVGLIAKRVFGTRLMAKLLSCGDIGEIHRLQQKPLGDKRLDIARAHVDVFDAISHDIEAELAAIGIPPERRPYIPNGVDTRHFAPVPAATKGDLRRSLQLPSGLVITYVGRLIPGKRVGSLLQIWPEVRAAHPDAVLVVVGSGPLESELRQASPEGVIFVGAQDDVAPYLQAADVFVLPSAGEGLANAMLEALSCGLPVIVTGVSGAKDVIQHGVNGWIVPPDDLAALRVACVTLLSDPELRVAIGHRGRERILREYALDSVASRLCALYMAVAGTRRYRNPIPVVSWLKTR